jgi:hypothetical protein
MNRSEAERIAYAVVAMIIQDSDAYELIEGWAKDETEIAQLHEALTAVRDEIESRAGMVTVAEGEPEVAVDDQRSNSLFDDETIAEGESK